MCPQPGAALNSGVRLRGDGYGEPGRAGGDHRYLMGPDGCFATLLPFGTDPERMAEVIRGYLPP